MDENKVPVQEIKSIEPVRGRIVSVDVLRGFDMFWIVGGAGFFIGILKLVGGRIEQIFLPQLEHAEWAGFHFFDLIFPLFVFIIGMSVVFSLQKIIATKGKKAAYNRLIRRTLLLFLLGLLYYGGMKNGFQDIRLGGVLQRLALCYFFAGMLFIHFRTRGLVVAFSLLLLGYWAWLSFIPVPGLGHTSFAMGENWTNWIDAHYLPLRKIHGTWENQGILSTFPAVASALLGIFASQILLNKSIGEMKKVYYFIGGGVALVIAGYLWGLQFPIIKRIWTSSYVLVAGGYSFMLLGVFYLGAAIRRRRTGNDVWRQGGLSFIDHGLAGALIAGRAFFIQAQNIHQDLSDIRRTPCRCATNKISPPSQVALGTAVTASASAPAFKQSRPFPAAPHDRRIYPPPRRG